MAYGVWHKCCCAGGCNGWTQTGDQPAGFNAGDSKTSCESCGTGWAPGAGGDASSPCCCGPEVPTYVDFACSTAWAFAWNRDGQAITCMGAAAQPDDPPVASTPCPTGDTNLDVWEYDTGGTNSGGWWVDAGNVDITLEPGNQEAIDADDDETNHPPSCCATYYYGKCDLTGPATPAFTDNPWGYGAGYFAVLSTYLKDAPDELEAYARLSLIFAGESGTLRLRATLSLYVAIKGVTLTSGGTLSHYTDFPDIPTTARVPALRWVCDSHIDVAEGCSCNFGYGEELVDLLDWGAITDDGSYWTKQHAYPFVAGSPATAVYTKRGGGTGGAGGGPLCGTCGAKPCGCTAETFSLNNVSGCDSCSSVGCAETAIWYAIGNASNVTRAYPANYVLAAASQDGNSVPWIVMPADGLSDFGWANAANSYAATGYGASGGKAWRTHSLFDSVPCISPIGSRNTAAMRGGFVGGSPVYQPGIGPWMPSCGLSDVVITENFPS